MMAVVKINGIIYADSYELSNIKETFTKIYRKYNSQDDSRVYTIINAMTITALQEFKLSTDYEDTYKMIYDTIKGYDTHPPMCTICGKKPVEWNVKTHKYSRVCSNPDCAKKAREQFTTNMQNKLGVTNLADDPEHQKKMLAGRGISKEYVFKDGGIKTLVGTQEYKSVAKLETIGYTSDRLEIPGKVFNYYHPVEKKTKMHISDIFIPEDNLVISCKDGLDNPNTHPNMAKDRLKSIYEYIHILNETPYNYIQIEGDSDIEDLPKIISKVKEFNKSGSRYVIPPRVDIMFAESIGYDSLRFYFLTDERGIVLISWFSADRDSNKGLILFEDGVGVYDFTYIFNSPLAINLFYLDVQDYTPYKLRYDKELHNIQSNLQMLKSIYTGILSDTDTYLRRVYMVDIKDISNKIKSYHMDYSDSIYIKDVVDNIHRNENTTIFDSPIDNINIGDIGTLDSPVYFHLTDKGIVFTIFDMSAVIVNDTGICIIKSDMANRPHNGILHITERLRDIMYVAMCSNIGISVLLKPETFGSTDIRYDVSDVLYILINNMIYGQHRRDAVDNLLDAEVSISLKDISRDINAFRVYRTRANVIKHSTVDVYECDYSNDSVLNFNKYKLICKKRNKAIRAFIEDHTLISEMRKFEISYSRSNRISDNKILF